MVSREGASPKQSMSFRLKQRATVGKAGSAGREKRDFRQGKVGALVGKSKEHTYVLNIEHGRAPYRAGTCTISSTAVQKPSSGIWLKRNNHRVVFKPKPFSLQRYE